MKRQQNLLITGASGFVGSRITEALQGQYNLITPSHSELDITSAEKVEDFISLTKPDIILHLAAISNTGYCEEHPDESFLVNVVSVENLFCGADVHAIACLFRPRNIETDVKIRAKHRRFGRAEGRFGHALVFLEQLFTYFVGELGIENLLRVFVDLGHIAELVLNDADLFTEIVFFLVLIEVGAHALVNVKLAFEKLAFLVDERDDQLDAANGIKAFKNALLVGIFN